MVKVVLQNANGSLPLKLGRDTLHSNLCHRNLAEPRHSPIWTTETVPCRATFQHLPPKMGRDALHFYLCHQNWAATRYTPFSATVIWLCRATVPSGPTKLCRAALHSITTISYLPPQRDILLTTHLVTHFYPSADMTLGANGFIVCNHIYILLFPVFNL